MTVQHGVTVTPAPADPPPAPAPGVPPPSVADVIVPPPLRVLRELRDLKLPAVIPVPSVRGTTGLGLRQVQESVKKAVGMDIFAHDEAVQSAQATA